MADLNGTGASPTIAGLDQNGIEVLLTQLLTPVMGDEKAGQILEWMRREVRTRPLVSYCWDGLVDKAWQLGEDSPISEGRTVFAMMHWEDQRCVAAFCFKPIEVNGRNAVQFFRELIMKPAHITGPVSHEALFSELRQLLVEDVSIAIEGYIEHLGKRLDAKTMDRIVEASSGFVGFDFAPEGEEAPTQ